MLLLTALPLETVLVGFIMDYRLVYCLQNGLPLDMDVYDMAEWCCLGPLTRISLENGSAPVTNYGISSWWKRKGSG